VIHDGQGNLSGYGWSPNSGWIMFKSDHGDGLYSDRDGRIAAAIQLGKEGYNAAPPPTIHQVHPPMELIIQNLAAKNTKE
jgi:hypothetical protein